MLVELSAKRAALLKEAFPKLSQGTVLWNPDRPDNRPEVQAMQEGGTRAGIKVRSAEARSREELASQLDAIGWDGTQAILNAGDTLLGSSAQSIVDRAAKLKLPALYEDRDYVIRGGLMSYGPDMRAMHRRAAEFVDKILKGAKPADLPIEQPTRFDFVLNKKAAKALGVTFPPIILLQATEVIE